jgi:hypothetical protein
VATASAGGRLPGLARIHLIRGVRSQRHLARPLVSTTPGKLPGIHTAGVNKVELRVPIDPSEQFQAILVPGGLAFE